VAHVTQLCQYVKTHQNVIKRTEVKSKIAFCILGVILGVFLENQFELLSRWKPPKTESWLGSSFENPADTSHIWFQKEFPSNFPFCNKEDELVFQRTLETPEINLIIFSDNDCGYCSELFQSLDELNGIQTFDTEINVVSVSLLQDEHALSDIPDWCSSIFFTSLNQDSSYRKINQFFREYELHSIPVIWVVKGGDILERFVGAKDIDYLINYLYD